MRIIAGKFRRRRLFTPKDASVTRPIPDRVKESLFSLLRGNIEDARVVDCFAGTGAIGLEAISRGARQCVFIERDKRIADLLDKNVKALACDDQAAIVCADALSTPVLTRINAMGGADLIFLDPPYPLLNDSAPSGGWERCRAQLPRLIASLSDAGFLCLRTPWPFRHFDDQCADLPQSPSHSDSPGSHSRATPAPRDHTRAFSRTDRPKGKKKSRRKDEHQWIGPDIDIQQIIRETRELERQSRDHDPDDDLLDDPGLDDPHSPDFDDPAADDRHFDPDLDPLAEPHPSQPADPSRTPHPSIPPRKFHLVDLAIPGAVGPETHIYGSTAIHLYMKLKSPPLTPLHPSS